MAANGTYSQMANYLTTGYWTWLGGRQRKFDHLNLTVDISALQTPDQAFAKAALDLWTDVSGLTYSVVTTGGADITFQDTGAGAITNTSITYGATGPATITSATVNIDPSWGGGVGASIDSYRFHTFIHEIGHALGLGHQGPYNATASYPTDAVFTNDSWQESVMSYFDQNVNTSITATKAYVLTPQIVDILAVQGLYGAGTARPGNTIYGVGNNTGRASYEAGFTDMPTVTIYDTGGRDKMDYSGTPASGVVADQTIDLRPGGISSVYGKIGNVIIAKGTIIEDAVGGSGKDRIIGNGAGNVLQGGGGRDSLIGKGGADRLLGGAGRDKENGGGGNDHLLGGGGHDRLNGGAGQDTLIGGRGNDRLHGGNGADVLKGGAGNDVMQGGRGADVFVFAPGDGNDRIVDFADNTDTVQLDARLWGGGLTAQQVLNTYAHTTLAGDVVLDFGGGTDTLTFTGLGSTNLLLNDMVIV